MRNKKNVCFPSIGFFVCLVLIVGFISALSPCGCNMSNSMVRAKMTAVGVRGRDIYVAIVTANTERESLGLPPIWPSDAPPYTNHVTGCVECFDFDNSTDYFAYIFDEANYGTDNWKPLVSGFDYGKLAGAGVKAHSGVGPLVAENNMWTIAKNVTEEMEDVIPILITRNLDPAYLLSEVKRKPASSRIPLGETWENPFSNKGAVLIRKGGGLFMFRAKYATPQVIYNVQSAYVIKAGSKYPLKYLTPNKEVVPVGKTN